MSGFPIKLELFISPVILQVNRLQLPTGLHIPGMRSINKRNTHTLVIANSWLQLAASPSHMVFIRKRLEVTYEYMANLRIFAYLAFVFAATTAIAFAIHFRA